MNCILLFELFGSFSQQKPTRCTIFQIYFIKELFMFRADLLSIIRSPNTVYTATGICYVSYVDCLLARSTWPLSQIWEIVHVVGFYYKNTSRCTVLWMSNSYLVHVSTHAREGTFLTTNTCILIICSDYLKRKFITLRKIMFYLCHMHAFKFGWEDALYNYVYRIMEPPPVLRRFLLIE